VHAATVNGVPIAVEEVEREYRKLLLEMEDRIPGHRLESLRPQLRKQALESAVNLHLLLQEADRRGIEADAGGVEARYREIAGRFPRAEDLRTVLDSMGFSGETFREELARNLKIEVLLNQALGSPERVSEDDVEAFYRDHPETFSLQEKVRASHILIPAEAKDPEPVRVGKRLEISRLRRELEQGGDFAGLASRYSGCPTKSQGGDLGFFERGRMEKPFEDAAFSLRPGEISEVVETQFGYHLILATARQEAGIVPLEEVRDQVAEHLIARKNQDRIGAFLETLRLSAAIKYPGDAPA